MLFPENFMTRSQDLNKVYHDAGQFYVSKDTGNLEARYIGPDSLPIPIPHYRVQDIDSEEDWVRAELIYKTLEQLGTLA